MVFFKLSSQGRQTLCPQPEIVLNSSGVSKQMGQEESSSSWAAGASGIETSSMTMTRESCVGGFVRALCANSILCSLARLSANAACASVDKDTGSIM